MRRTGIIIAIVIGLAVVGIGVAAFVIRQRAAAPAGEPVTNTNAGTAPAPADMALQNGNAAPCHEAVDDADRDLCLMTYVRGSGDVAACADATETARAACERAGAEAVAKKATSVIPCQTLAEADRGECQNAVYSFVGAEGCGSLGDARDACERYHEATAAEEGAPGTPPVSPTVDRDGDGLADVEEALYGADPSKADTDGDGYQDGDEVRAGYNPAGPGKGVRILR